MLLLFECTNQFQSLCIFSKFGLAGAQKFCLTYTGSRKVWALSPSHMLQAANFKPYCDCEHILFCILQLVPSRTIDSELLSCIASTGVNLILTQFYCSALSVAVCVFVRRAACDSRSADVFASVFYLPKPRPLNYLINDLWRGPTGVIQGEPGDFFLRKVVGTQCIGK